MAARLPLILALLLLGVFLSGAGWGALAAAPALALLGSLLAARLRPEPSPPPTCTRLTVFVSALLTLFYELLLIRYHSVMLPIFGYFKNVSLLACFLGLGLGYQQAGAANYLPWVAWLSLAQVILLEVTRFVLPALGTPAWGDVLFGIQGASGLQALVRVYAFLGLMFLLTAATCVPLGRLAGSCMQGMPALRAYGWNLAGSLAGIALYTLISVAGTPPQLWFGLAALLVLWFLRDQRLLCMALFLAIMGLDAMDPDQLALHRLKLYSPYQVLAVDFTPRAPDASVLTVQANHDYYQKVFDFRTPPRPREAAVAKVYYEAPYRFLQGPFERVLILGAGTGNDVAGALRNPVGRVDAVELDPRIAALGRSFHPERPYDDPRVHLHITDSRQFLRQSTDRFDLIVYGLLDSHANAGMTSNLRLDSFVYTVEGLRRARQLLAPNGHMVLTFSINNERALGGKIFRMLTEAFDGQQPRAFVTGYDVGVMFIMGPQTAKLRLQPEVTEEFAALAGSVAPSTDDWPFFYILRKAFPVDYACLLAFLLVLTVLFLVSQRGPARHGFVAEFFCLGAGFMLIETRTLTELGVSLGNTWLLVPLVIAAILTLAVVANALVAWLGSVPLLAAYGLLLGGLAVEALANLTGRFADVGALQLLVLVGPLFFASVVFSESLRRHGDIASCLYSNLMGAMVGGCLEYASLMVGFHALTWLTLGLYALALLTRRAS